MLLARRRGHPISTGAAQWKVGVIVAQEEVVAHFALPLHWVVVPEAVKNCQERRPRFISIRQITGIAEAQRRNAVDCHEKALIQR